MFSAVVFPKTKKKTKKKVLNMWVQILKGMNRCQRVQLYRGATKGLWLGCSVHTNLTLGDHTYHWVLAGICSFNLPAGPVEFLPQITGSAFRLSRYFCIVETKARKKVFWSMFELCGGSKLADSNEAGKTACFWPDKDWLPSIDKWGDTLSHCVTKLIGSGFGSGSTYFPSLHSYYSKERIRIRWGPLYVFAW